MKQESASSFNQLKKQQQKYIHLCIFMVNMSHFLNIYILIYIKIQSQKEQKGNCLFLPLWVLPSNDKLSCRSYLVFVLDVRVAGGVQCSSAVVAEYGAGVGCHWGAVDRAGQRAETRCWTGSIWRRRPAGVERCALRKMMQNLL